MPAYRKLGPQDFKLTSKFFKAYYPQTIFSDWMLEQPFVGIFENDVLVATAGTVTSNQYLGSANLGNFLTHPDWRGRGLAKQAATALMSELRKTNLSIFSLGTTEDNVAAWRAYEAIGFQHQESRPELHVLKKT